MFSKVFILLLVSAAVFAVPVEDVQGKDPRSLSDWIEQGKNYFNEALEQGKKTFEKTLEAIKQTGKEFLDIGNLQADKLKDTYNQLVSDSKVALDHFKSRMEGIVKETRDFNQIKEIEQEYTNQIEGLKNKWNEAVSQVAGL